MSKISKFHQKSHFFGKNAKIMKFCPNVKIDPKTVWKHQNRRWKALSWNFPKIKKIVFLTIFGHYIQFFIPTCRFRTWGILASRMPYWSSKMAKSRELEFFFSEIKNMDHKLSNDVSNVFWRPLVQILSHFEIFSKHVILTRKRRGGLKKKNVTIFPKNLILDIKNYFFSKVF